MLVALKQTLVACGTPFAGDLARPGDNMKAPLAAVYLLAQGPENKIEPVGAAEAARGMLTNILFFAQDAELVQAVFRSALEFVEQVNWWIGWVEEVPGVNCQEATRAALLESLRITLAEAIEFNRMEARSATSGVLFPDMEKTLR